MARMSSNDNSSIFWTSWEVRKPSKKCTKGTRLAKAAAWLINAKSITSCTEPEASRPKPVDRVAMTSE